MKIDTSGLSCPEPVLRTKNAIKSKPATIEVVVDNNTAMQNVKRFLENSGYKVSLDNLLVKGEK